MGTPALTDALRSAAATPNLYVRSFGCHPVCGPNVVDAPVGASR